MNYASVVLFSGGKDSTAALWWARNRYHNSVLALSIDYRGRPRREGDIARQICSDHSIALAETALPFLAPLGLAFGGTTVNTRPQGYIPMRNLIFYAIAGYYADLYNCGSIVGGHVRSDGEAHSDASPAFFEALTETFGVALSKSFARAISITGHQASLTIELPLHGLTDTEAVQLGSRLGAPMEITWSCWENRDTPCGVCVSCKDRERAMADLSKA